jgi:heptosyltransferase-1
VRKCRPRPIETIDLSQLAPPRRVLIVKLSSLGDVIHAMPVVHDLHHSEPGLQIDWVVEPGFAPLVRRVMGIGRVIECAQRRWRKQGWRGWFSAEVRGQKRAYREQLQAQTYDAVIDLQGLTKSALVARQARLAPGGQRIALANRTDGSGYEPPTRWVADRVIRIEPHSHVVDRSRELCARAFGYVVQGPPIFGLQAQPVPFVRPTIALVHGTSRDDKLWPEALWVALGQRLVADGFALAWPQGSAQEAERAQRLTQQIGPAVCALWPSMSLDALVDRLGACVGVIGVDSGLSHLAVALDLPHVQLYNFPTAWRTGPLKAHGHAHQVSVGGEAVPTLEAVWQAWQTVWTASRP